MQTDLITKVYFNEHLTHSCVGMPQGLQALLSSFYLEESSNKLQYNEYFVSKISENIALNSWPLNILPYFTLNCTIQ